MSVSSVLSSVALRASQLQEVSARETGWFFWIRIALVAVLYAAPLAFGAVQVWAWSALAVLSVVLLVCWVVGCALKKQITVRWFALGTPLLLLLLLGAIQFIGGISLDKIATREALIKLATDFLIFFLVGQLFAAVTRKFWQGFGLTVVFYVFVLSLFAIVQFFSRPDLVYWSVKPQWGGAIFGPYINHNHYAGLMELLLPIAGAYVLGHWSRNPLRWVGAFAVLLAFASVELSGSRGGVISLLIEMGIWGVLFGRSRLVGRRRAAAISAIMAFSVVAMLLLIAPPEILERYQTLIKSPDLSLGMRKQMLMDTLHLFRDHPWLGTGLGSLETAYPRYQSVFRERVVEHAHNDFAELLAETGIVGMGLALIGVAVFLTTAFHKAKAKVDDLGGCIRLGAAVGCCGLLVHSLSDFNLHVPANAAWFVACAAISQLPHFPQLRERARSRHREVLTN